MVKVKVHLKKTLERPEGVKLYLYSFFNLGDRLLWIVNVRPRPLYPQERHRLLIVQEAGWEPGPIWMSAQKFRLTGIWTPDRPARGESLYELRYLEPHTVRMKIVWIRTYFNKVWYPVAPSWKAADRYIGRKNRGAPVHNL